MRFAFSKPLIVASVAGVILSGCSLLPGSDEGGGETGPEYVLCLTDEDCDVGREFCHLNQINITNLSLTFPRLMNPLFIIIQFF